MGTDSEAVVRADAVWKVFGGDAERAMTMADEGASREDIQDATGALVAVRDVSFEVQAGESFVVMGLSGSGKSTLIRCLARLIEPTGGNIRLCGEDLLSLDDDGLREMRRHRMSMVFQHFGLFPHRTVVDNVAYGLEVQGIDVDERRARANEQLAAVGLDAWAEHHPQQLSGGMQQRVGLARALVVDPEVLFFDEPFSALDPLIRRAMQDELLEIQARERRTIVFITHDFDEALRLADTIAIMKDGVFEQIGTAAEILTNPATPYVEAFTRDAPTAKILTVAAAMSPAPATSSGGRDSVTIDESASLEDALPLLLSSDEPLEVRGPQGRTTGVLRQSDVAALLANR